jgi:predicted anti-sigma-YlaC factor YlaD
VRNRESRSGDLAPMNCESARAELSAALDGEQALPLAIPLAEHLAGCADCRNWQDAAHQLTRRVRLTLARAIPDRAPQILDAVLADQAAHRRPTRGRRLARIGLVAAALAQFVILLPSLVMGHAGVGIPPHAARELGAFNLALAVGFAAAALRPAHARGMLPLVGVATSALVLLAIIDTAYGETTIPAELPHVIAIAGWLLLYRLARTDQVDSDGSGPTGQHPRGRRWLTFWRRPRAGGLYAGIVAAGGDPATVLASGSAKYRCSAENPDQVQDAAA